MKSVLHRFSEPADALLERLEKAAVRDKQAERNLKIGCAVFVIGGIGGLFGLAALSERLGSNWPFLGLLALVGVLAFILGEHGHDVDDRKLAGATALVRKLRADVPLTEPVQLLVDFRDYQKGGTQVRDPETKKSKTGAGDKFQQKWLEVRTTLADGTQVTAAITDRVTRKTKRKRKYVKVKETFACDVSLLLRLDKRYGDAERVLPRLSNDRWPDGCMVRDRSGSGRRLFVTTRTPQVRVVSNRGGTSGREYLASGGAVLELLRWVYRGIAASGTGSGSGAKAS